MGRMIDLDAVLGEIPGDNPAGADLRYDAAFEEIREARRSEDPLTSSGGEPKRADWEKVVDLCATALTERTKDLQIGAWLTEALINSGGFPGFVTGLKVLQGLVGSYWETVYPLIEDGDLEYRIGPLEFMNEKLWVAVKEIPVTDPGVTDGYSLLKYQESQAVGYEKDILDQHGNVDEGKKAKRDEWIAEGKLTADAFDAAVERSPRSFYESLHGSVTACAGEFEAFEKILDSKFGKESPRMAELRKAIEECEQFLKFRLDEKRRSEPMADPGPASAEIAVDPVSGGTAGTEAPAPVAGRAGSEKAAAESALWQEALRLLGTSGIKGALELLIGACYTAPSVRDRARLRLLMARLCLKADRPDLCRPIIEELHGQIVELHLEKWESPLWIAEVLDTLYQCLVARDPSEEDLTRARALFQQMCTTDVTRAMFYKG